MLKIGITGQSGFIGTHLFNTLNLYPDRFNLVSFEDDFFKFDSNLKEFVRNCDVIVHLAALNRPDDLRVIYETNLALVKKLINVCEETDSVPHILFSSSIQEEMDNPYGKSKKEGRLLFDKWAMENNGIFTGLVIPDVFGPFSKPFYNSVVATFCYQLTHGEQPKIEVDGKMKLIYIDELVREIIKHIEAMHNYIQTEAVADSVLLPHTTSLMVSELFEKLLGYKRDYFGSGIIPVLGDPFERNLFNTFLCYADHSTLFPFHLKLNTDDRGSFVEILKSGGGQFSLSTTKPTITRGNHFHTRKVERFAVIKGKARIDIRRVGTDKKISFTLDGENPSFVDMPIWYTHNITNTGDDDLYTLFWISEFYNPNDSDTFFEEV